MVQEQLPQIELEKLKYHNLSGLQGRMILMADNLDPETEFTLNDKDSQKIFQETNRVDQAMQTVVGITDELSLETRLEHWQNKRYEEAMKEWRGQVASKIKKFGHKHQVFLTKLGITNLNQFNTRQAQELYNRFAVAKTDQAPLQFFLQTVVEAYENNLPELEANLVSVQWLAGIFGHDEAEIIANLLHAKIKTLTKPVEFAAEVVSRCPKEQLTDREKTLLTRLHSKQNPKPIEPPESIEPPETIEPPINPELGSTFSLEDWFAAIKAPVNSNQPFYVSQLPQDLTIASEGHKLKEPFFVFREDEKNQRFASPNYKVAAWVEELEINQHDPRYLEAEAKT